LASFFRALTPLNPESLYSLKSDPSVSVSVWSFDQFVLNLFREKQYSDKMNKMQRGELAEFEACFTFACPKVSISFPFLLA
jgi:hypothetical protein